MMQVVDDILAETQPANYEIQSFLMEENEMPKYLKVKSESMILEVYFTSTKSFRFFDKKQTKIMEHVIIDDSHHSRLREQMEVRNTVCFSDARYSSTSSKSTATTRSSPST